MSDCGCGEGLKETRHAVEMMHREMARILLAMSTPIERYVQTVPRMLVGVIPGGATTLVNSLGPPVMGTVWKVERISKHATAGTPQLDILVGPESLLSQPDDAYRRDYSPASQDDQADEFNPIYVSTSDYLVCSWSAATAASTVSAAFQIGVYRVGIPAGVS